jgi:lysozyme family protein
MADFHIAYPIVHANEGGYVNVASDKGGETYAGISRVWHPTWPGWVLIEAWKAIHGTPKRYQFIEMPGLVDDVVSFYKGRWDDIMGDRLRSQAVANQLYDFATGTGKAVKIAQEVLVNMGFTLTPDNAFGPKTLAAVNAADPQQFFTRLKAARIAYYHYLVQQDAGQQVNLDGWLIRANRFLYAEKKTLSGSPLVA